MPIWLLLFVGLMLLPSSALAQSSEAERYCARQYPNISQYFTRRDCVKAETQKEEEENLRRRRAEEARPCIAIDIGRMEGVAGRITAAIKAEMSLEQAKETLSSILGYESPIIIPDDDIKERVVANSIRTKCNANFRFLINVRAGSDNKLRWLRTWAQDAPAGYPGDYQRKFSIEFEESRREEQRRIDQAKHEEEYKIRMAKVQEEQAE